jgi:hypothetical protein
LDFRKGDWLIIFPILGSKKSGTSSPAGMPPVTGSRGVFGARAGEELRKPMVAKAI